MLDRQLHAVQERIDQACQRVGRNPNEVELLLVTKGIEVARMQSAYNFGSRSFGENKVQELTSKKEHLPKDIKWHFIGHLQTNKAKSLVKQVVLIHSCDRIELARELEKQAEKANESFEVLLQVNASGESTKHGFRPEAVERSVSEMKAFNRLKIRGLMTMGPNTKDEKLIRLAFSKLRNLRDQLGKQFPDLDWHYLSMGMSLDFEYAVEEGANLLRIGTAVFGERK